MRGLKEHLKTVEEFKASPVINPTAPFILALAEDLGKNLQQKEFESFQEYSQRWKDADSILDIFRHFVNLDPNFWIEFCEQFNLNNPNRFTVSQISEWAEANYFKITGNKSKPMAEMKLSEYGQWKNINVCDVQMDSLAYLYYAASMFTFDKTFIGTLDTKRTIDHVQKSLLTFKYLGSNGGLRHE